jgi:hypothetical protein
MDPHMDPEAWRVWFLMVSAVAAVVLLGSAALCGWGVWRIRKRIRKRLRAAEWPTGNGRIRTAAATLRSLL